MEDGGAARSTSAQPALGRRRPRPALLARRGTAPPPQPQHQHQHQKQQQQRLSWLKPRLRRRSRGSGSIPSSQQQQQEQQEQQEQHDDASPPSSSSSSSSSFPPLLRPSSPPLLLPASSDVAAAPPSPSPSPPMLLEQLALGAVGALTAAFVTGLSALQLQQQLLGGAGEGLSVAAAAAAAAANADGRAENAATEALDSIRPMWRSAAVSSSAGLGGFPLVLQPAAAPATATTTATAASASRRPPARPQRLLAVGTRYWGGGAWWDGRSLMKVKIYDFALYADAHEARRALRSPPLQSAPFPPPPNNAADVVAPGGGLADALAASPGASDVPATILLRAARDVPLSRLADEYERILRRRVAAALAADGGGDNDEPALRGLLSAFRDASRLPASAVRFGSGPGGEPAVARGASLLFERLPGGRVLTRCIAPSSSSFSSSSSSSSSSSPSRPSSADGCGSGGNVDEDGGGDAVTTLADVTSPVLARALFGLYLGADQPVSQKARDAAADSLGRLLLPPPVSALSAASAARAAPLYRPRRGDRVVCELEVTPLDDDDGRHEHDACALVPALE